MRLASLNEKKQVRTLGPIKDLEPEDRAEWLRYDRLRATDPIAAEAIWMRLWHKYMERADRATP